MPVDHYENFPVASLLLPKRLRKTARLRLHRRCASPAAPSVEGAGRQSLRQTPFTHLHGAPGLPTAPPYFGLASVGDGVVVIGGAG